MMIATVALALIAWRVKSSWKDEQKRKCLVLLFESLNKYMQDLQYYELESTIFSKKNRENISQDVSKNELMVEYKFIDNELSEVFGECLLSMKNWLIENDNQEIIINKLLEKTQKYRFEIFEYIQFKIDFFIKQTKPANIIYGLNADTAIDMLEHKKNLLSSREDITNTITEFKELNKKLLK
ncbi:MAG: hypothetical protein R3Y28_03400 [Candidatus Gastranaerophilales bacterium]